MTRYEAVPAKVWGPNDLLTIDHSLPASSDRRHPFHLHWVVQLGRQSLDRHVAMDSATAETVPDGGICLQTSPREHNGTTQSRKPQTVSFSVCCRQSGSFV